MCDAQEALALDRNREREHKFTLIGMHILIGIPVCVLYGVMVWDSKYRVFAEICPVCLLLSHLILMWEKIKWLKNHPRMNLYSLGQSHAMEPT